MSTVNVDQQPSAPVAEPATTPPPGPALGGGDARVRPLDGIRAVAVLAVLGYHADLLAAGYLGVDVFFVLSGFLITTLLLRERERRGRVSLRGFWVRRALRLLPALYAYLAVGLVLVAVIKPARDALDQLEETISVLLCTGNWWELLRPESLGVWNGHLWSLSVEQEFYLFWPPALMLLVACSRRLSLRWSLAALVLAVEVWRVTLLRFGGSGSRVYLGLDTRADALLMGALVAALLAAGLLARVPARVWAVAAGAGWAVLAALVLLGPHLGDRPTWMDYVGFSLAALAAGTVVSSVICAPAALGSRILASRPLAWLGGISYAFYLWHYPIVVMADSSLAPRIGRAPAVLIAVGATLVVAECSMRFVEAPVARRRARLLAYVEQRPRRAVPLSAGRHLS